MSLFNLFKKVQPEKVNKPIDLDNTFYSMKIKQLPNNFAQTVMDLEMRLEFSDTYDLQVVKQLNELYKLAIEFYIHQDAKKANHFQKKLTHLLTDPQTLMVIEKRNQKTQTYNYEKNLKSQLHNFNAQSGVVVQSMLEGAEKKIERSVRMINQNISEQESRLVNRLQKRSKSKSRKVL